MFLEAEKERVEPEYPEGLNFLHLFILKYPLKVHITFIEPKLLIYLGEGGGGYQFVVRQISQRAGAQKY